MFDDYDAQSTMEYIKDLWDGNVQLKTAKQLISLINKKK